MNSLTAVALIVLLLGLSFIILMMSYDREKYIFKNYFYPPPVEPPRRPNYRPDLPATGGISYAGRGPCEEYCPSNVCSEYRDRQKKLNNCLKCSLQGLCITDTASGTCGKCIRQSDKNTCYDQFGCRDVNFKKGNFQLVNPKYTKCQLCPS